MPRHGVTAFSPTTVACPPDELRAVLRAVRACREHPADGRARVLPAHLESNFINPDYKGAQPAACLRLPGSAFGRARRPAAGSAGVVHRGRHPRRDRRGRPGRRHRHGGVGAGRRPRSHPASRERRTHRVARPLGGDLRAGRARPSAPARGTRRTCSTACRRWAIASPGWPARSCRRRKWRRRSSATRTTCTRRWCAWRWRPRAPIA